MTKENSRVGSVQAENQKARLKILIPREHGALTTLFVPFFVGFGVAKEWDAKAALLLGATLFRPLFTARPGQCH